MSYEITYTGADAVTLSSDDVTLHATGDAAGAVNVSGAGTSTRVVTITDISGDGTLAISIAAATASHIAGNNAAAAGPSDVVTVDSGRRGCAASGAAPNPAVPYADLAAILFATMIVCAVRRPDPARWDLGRLSPNDPEDRELSEQGLAEWADELDQEDRR